jgi:microcompartment protein CcmK/EutM
MYDLKGTADSSGACTLRSNRLKAGQLLFVQIVSLRQDDNNNVLVRVGIDRAGAFYEVETVDLVKKGRTYSYSHQFCLESDCQLRLDFTGAGSSGVCYAWVYGYLTDDG